jgi:hypothetical protein
MQAGKKGETPRGFPRGVVLQTIFGARRSRRFNRRISSDIKAG